MGPTDDLKDSVLSHLVESLKVISKFLECRNVYKKIYGNLAQRVKLLSPLFEELRDSDEELSEDDLKALESLSVALDSAKDVLQSINGGSKLYQGKTAQKFQQVTEQIEAVLSEIHYDNLDIFEEIELVHAQFQRAQGRLDSFDFQMDLVSTIAQKEKDPEPTVLKRLSEKLHLKTINDVKKESYAFHELVISSGGAPRDSLEGERGLIKHRSPVIPNDFICPISLELMRDPVIVSTGQTLLHTALTPNYVLKSLIALWCENNGVELPKQQANWRSKKLGCKVLDCDHVAVNALLEKLASGILEQQREHADTTLLNLSINESNKGTIVNMSVIPDIVDVLKNGSMEARENAAATLFSLSVIDEYKMKTEAAGAIPALITFLCDGTPRSKKDAATAIFNLSIYQRNKAMADAGNGMVDEALAILVILTSHLEGKAAICQVEPIPILVEIIRTVLWSLSTGGLEKLKLVREFVAEKALKELLENGTDRAKRKAGNVLELLQ
ncbi:hypothetical protein I3843_14G115400 [Carya illinoinensis]|nr:hypothetical protein I3843_14G115400 [Carya illinoinensis]